MSPLLEIPSPLYGASAPDDALRALFQAAVSELEQARDAATACASLLRLYRAWRAVDESLPEDLQVDMQRAREAVVDFVRDAVDRYPRWVPRHLPDEILFGAVELARVPTRALANALATELRCSLTDAGRFFAVVASALWQVVDRRPLTTALGELVMHRRAPAIAYARETGEAVHIPPARWLSLRTERSWRPGQTPRRGPLTREVAARLKVPEARAATVVESVFGGLIAALVPNTNLVEWDGVGELFVRALNGLVGADPQLGRPLVIPDRVTLTLLSDMREGDV